MKVSYYMEEASTVLAIFRKAFAEGGKWHSHFVSFCEGVRLAGKDPARLDSFLRQFIQSHGEWMAYLCAIRADHMGLAYLEGWSLEDALWCNLSSKEASVVERNLKEGLYQ